VPQKPHGRAVIEMPNDLDVVVTREFEAPIALVFDVLTKPEHVSKWFAPFECQVTECSIDLRVGGNYHIVFVTGDGISARFVEPTWRSNRRPGPSRRGCSKGGQMRRPSSPWICTKPME
jgi:Activator of Hsp90 ATPase homolog 1-like protein